MTSPPVTSRGRLSRAICVCRMRFRRDAASVSRPPRRGSLSGRRTRSAWIVLQTLLERPGSASSRSCACSRISFEAAAFSELEIALGESGRQAPRPDGVRIAVARPPGSRCPSADRRSRFGEEIPRIALDAEVLGHDLRRPRPTRSSSASVARFGVLRWDGLGARIDRRHQDAGLRLVDRGLPTRHEECHRDRQQRDGQDRPLAEPQDGEDFLQVEPALLLGELRRAHGPDGRGRRLVWPRTLGHGPPQLAGARTTLSVAARFPLSAHQRDDCRWNLHPLSYMSSAAVAPCKRRRRYPFGASPCLPERGEPCKKGTGRSLQRDAASPGDEPRGRGGSRRDPRIEGGSWCNDGRNSEVPSSAGAVSLRWAPRPGSVIASCIRSR